MYKTRVLRLFPLVVVLSAAAAAQTYIRAVLPNPAHESAVGYRFEILTPGEVLQGVVRAHPPGRFLNDQGYIRLANASESEPAALSNAALHTALPRLVAGLRTNERTVSFRFDQAIAPDETIDLRVAFTPKDYWRVYFNDVFQYANGKTIRSRIPYAAFFINVTPTSDPQKMMASLTVVNNIASTYGIAPSVVNDAARMPINFRNAQVYVNNSLGHYDLTHFDRPDGQRLELPTSFTLKAGEAQTFDLGVVAANTYIYTVSEISYQDVGEYYAVACAHPTNPQQQTAQVSQAMK